MLHRWSRAALAAPLVVALRSARAPRRTPRRSSVDGASDRQPRRPAARGRRHDADAQLEAVGQRRRRAPDRVRGRGHRRAGAELWDSGQVASSAPRATYAGLRSPRARGSRGRYARGTATATRRPGARRRRSRWACSRRADWGAAKWIHLPPPPLNRAVVIDVGEQDGALRPPRRDQARPRRSSSPPTAPSSRIQLAELQVLAPDGTNLALGTSVSAFDQFQSQGWGTKQLTDGRITSPGYMSRQSVRRRTPTRRSGCRSTSARSSTSTRSCSIRAATRARPTGRSRTSRSTSRSALVDVLDADDRDQDASPTSRTRPAPT